MLASGIARSLSKGIASPLGGGGGDAPVPDPSQLFGADLFKWHVAGATDIVLNGSALASWPDIKGNGAFQEPDGILQPVWSATSFDGHPGVTSDGVRSRLRATFSALPSNSLAYIWVAAKVLSNGLESGALFDLCPDPSGAFATDQYLAVRTSDMSETGTPGKVQMESTMGGGHFVQTGPAVDYSARHVYSAGIVGADGGGAPAASRFRIDGTEYNGNGTGRISSTHPMVNLSLFTWEGMAAFAHATIAEVVMILRLPTAGEKSAVDQYFKHRYGMVF
jgi:hypothetical protein